MANSTISVTFKVTDADGSWKKLSGDADGFKKIVESTLQPVDNLQKKVINWTAASQAFTNLNSAIGNLQGIMSGLTEAYNVQIQNETRLTTVMQQRMGATQADIQSIKDLTAAQQQEGVIGDEVQLAGAQQVATFIKQKSSLDTLIPAMNNLIAQQKGLNATTGDAQAIGNLMGKAMQGQVSALTRVGITMTEAQQQTMKYGSEEERAAMLAEIITDNVGNMNQALAQTDAGQQVQMANAMGDMKEEIGAMLEPISGVVMGLAEMGRSVTSIGQLYSSLSAAVSAIRAMVTVEGMHAAAAKVAAAATMAWQGAQWLLNAVMSANPIGLVVVAIGALVTAIVLAYKNCESFRNICDKVWAVAKSLASMVWDKLCKAFAWLGEKLKVVWNFIKGIFGIKSDPFKNMTNGANQASSALGGLEDKMSSLTSSTSKSPKMPSMPKTTTAAAPVYKENANTIADINSNISVLQERLNKAAVGTLEFRNAVGALANEQKKLDAANSQKDAFTEMDGSKRFQGVSILPDSKSIAKVTKDMGHIKLPKAVTEVAASGDAAKEGWQDAANAIKQAGAAMSNLGSPVLNVVGTVAQAVATIALGYAQTTAQASTLGPWGWIAFAATGLATMLSMIASVKDATAFADGGVIYGPTLGLMGEYAGASSNPEVVAPLSKLQSIIGGAGGTAAGALVGRVRGRNLELVMANDTRLASKSGRRTNIII